MGKYYQGSYEKVCDFVLSWRRVFYRQLSLRQISHIQTGRSYQGVVVLPLDCVYQKVQGNAYPWYVRQVTEDGIFVQEVEVEIGYISGNQVCVNGIAEGTYYDTGYKAVAGGLSL